jgi:hypothetical protein
MIPSPAIISKSANVATSSTCAASLPNDGATFWFCSGFEITAGGATAGGLVTATLTGLLGGTLNYTFGVPTGVTAAASPLVIEFPSALPSVDVNTNVVLTLPATGAGSTGASVNIHGYKGARQLNA